RRRRGLAVADYRGRGARDGWGRRGCGRDPQALSRRQARCGEGRSNDRSSFMSGRSKLPPAPLADERTVTGVGVVAIDRAWMPGRRGALLRAERGGERGRELFDLLLEPADLLRL